MIRWVKFWSSMALAAASVFFLAIVYAVVFIVMYFPRSLREAQASDSNEGQDPLA